MKRTRLPLIALLFLSLPAAAQHEEHGELHHEHQVLPTEPEQAPAHEDHGDRERHAAPADAVVDPGGPDDPTPRADSSDHSMHGVHPAPGAEPGPSEATEAAPHEHRNMVIDAAGMVMNHNPDRLPRDCSAISGEVDIQVLAGREFAASHGLVYGYDDPVWKVEPCSKVNVTLENRDAVRHQWMVHGLPRYLYPLGMFTLEVNGPGTRSASFIVPSGDQTFLVHCDVPHHMEKGMKGQLVVGSGDGSLPGVPGVSAPLFADRYPTQWNRAALVGAALALALGLAASLALRGS